MPGKSFSFIPMIYIILNGMGLAGINDEIVIPSDKYFPDLLGMSTRCDLINSMT